MRIFKCWGLYLFLTVIPLLQSCLNDSNDWPEETKLALVTVRLFDNQSPSDYYFVMDNNQTIIPINTASLDYKAIDGQRAFVYFTFIENEVLSDESSTHYAEVIYIENILTKDIVELTAENDLLLGNDKIDITHVWLSNEYINIECRFYNENKEIKHMLSLACDSSELIDSEGDICLEFRHNAYYNVGLTLREGFVSYKLTNISEQLQLAKGIKIKVNTIQNGIGIYRLNLENHTSAN